MRTTVHDSAAVGTQVGGFVIGGSVGFRFYANGDCTGTGTDAGSATVAAGVAHPSDPRGPLAAGAYSFKATYAGDSNYSGSTSDCEPLTVRQASSSTSTDIHDA